LVTVGAAVAAVAVASLAGVESFTGGAGSAGLPLAVSPAAAAVLNKVADAVSAQVVPAAGQWQYSETRQEEIQPAAAAGLTIEVVATVTDQSWQAPDGATRLRQVDDGVAPLTKRGRATYLAHESAFRNLRLGLTEKGGRVQLDGLSSAAQEHSLGYGKQIWNSDPPSDPQTLLREISHWIRKNIRFTKTLGYSVSAQRRERLFAGLADILASSTSSRLRATAYRALSYLPDTKVLGTATDQLGRSGVAISSSGFPYSKFTLIVSASTGELLEEIESFQKGGPQKLAAGWQTRLLVLRRAIVGSPTSLPDGGHQPYPRPKSSR
jgi:hypothetical protein